jgi:adenosylcobinamide amidohydrolase
MDNVPEPELTHRREDGADIPMLVWRPAAPVLAISSGPLGGGIGVRHWVINATVPMSYDRDDPDRHLTELATGLGLAGPGVGLLTGVDVAAVVTAWDGGAAVAATVGLGAPAWAAAPDGHLRRESGRARPADQAYPIGTINIVAHLPVRLGDAALVNAVATVAEAKAQALWDLGVEATGTCTDATCLSCPPDGPVESYGGPRSTWGARLARAVHEAVRRGGQAWYAAPRSWSPVGEALSPVGEAPDPHRATRAVPACSADQETLRHRVPSAPDDPQTGSDQGLAFRTSDTARNRGHLTEPRTHPP